MTRPHGEYPATTMAARGTARSIGQPCQPCALNRVLEVVLEGEAMLALPSHTAVWLQLQQTSDRRPSFLHLSRMSQCTGEHQICRQVPRVLQRCLAQPHHRFRKLALK